MNWNTPLSQIRTSRPDEKRAPHRTRGFRSCCVQTADRWRLEEFWGRMQWCCFPPESIPHFSYSTHPGHAFKVKKTTTSVLILGCKHNWSALWSVITHNGNNSINIDEPRLFLNLCCLLWPCFVLHFNAGTSLNDLHNILLFYEGAVLWYILFFFKILENTVEVYFFREVFVCFIFSVWN